MGSIRFEGVRFSAFPNDHSPAHIHGKYGSGVIIVEIYRDRTVALANRRRAIKPRTMKVNDIKKVLLAAEECVDELWQLWEEARGKPAKNDRR